jgi:hypothetical protein
VLLPGSGFCTVTENVPALPAVPVAVNCVEETNVVVSAVVLNITCAPDTKLLPVSVSVKFPRFVEAGEMPLSVGVGFQSVTEAEPDFVVSAALVAVTLMVFGEGSVAGAVYLPVASTVPSVALPPAVEFTDHVTAVFVEPDTLAAKE